MTETTTDLLEAMNGDHALKVTGDRMAPEIQAGDHIIVRTAATADNGQTVVVKHDDGRVSLAEYKPGLEVMGLVVGLIRRLP